MCPRNHVSARWKPRTPRGKYTGVIYLSMHCPRYSIYLTLFARWQYAVWRRVLWLPEPRQLVIVLSLNITEILVCSVLEPMSDNVVCFLRKPTVQRLSGDGDEGDPRWISR